MCGQAKTEQRRAAGGSFVQKWYQLPTHSLTDGVTGRQAAAPSLSQCVHRRAGTDCETPRVDLLYVL